MDLRTLIFWTIVILIVLALIAPVFAANLLTGAGSNIGTFMSELGK